MGNDNARTDQRLGMCRVHLQVVVHALVDHLGLRHGHPPGPGPPRANSRAAATALSHLTAAGLGWAGLGQYRRIFGR
jgi:hypothetical protein